MYVAIYCHELGIISVRVALAKYENITWGIAGWSSKIHKVGSDTSPTARATVPQLGMVVHSNDMCVATCCHELGQAFGTCGSREVRNIYLGELLACPLKYTRCDLIGRPHPVQRLHYLV